MQAEADGSIRKMTSPNLEEARKNPSGTNEQPPASNFLPDKIGAEVEV
jgi:hypothetical protein